MNWAQLISFSYPDNEFLLTTYSPKSPLNKPEASEFTQLNQASFALTRKLIHRPKLSPAQLVNNFLVPRIAERSKSSSHNTFFDTTR
jgi:hypothetical protein